MNDQSDIMITAPCRTALMHHARAMYPVLRERAARCAACRKVPDETVAEMEAAGFFKVTQPKEYGGFEMPYHVFCEIVMEIARGCPSSGWVYAVIGEHNQTVGGHHTAEAMEDIWGIDPSTRVASGNAPDLEFTRSDGGWLVNGQLKYSSACGHCTWHLSAGVIDGAPMKFVFPRGHSEIVDTWHVIGMEGTGSHDIKLKDVFLADHCVVPAAHRGAKFNDAPLFRQPQWSTNPYSLASVIVGAAQGALDIFTNDIRERTPRMGGGFKIGGLQSIQMRIAESAAEIDAAKRMILGNLCETHEMLLAADTLTREIMARNRRDMAFAPILAKRAIERIFYASGATSIYLSQDLQRYFRDVNAGAQQIFLDWDANATIYGKVALDVDTGSVRW
ncbi:MAG: hypothetical protein F4Z55_04900 [Boseongicola sp. SB0667_bin_21]|nr:hypothetical protein [Boseongicola sp. SB0667_bin_21]